jgi:hypothetical protein
MALPEAEARDVSQRVNIVDLAVQKAEHDHIEVDDTNLKSGLEDAPPMSAFQNMPRSKAIRVFWKVALFSVLVAWTAIMDGFLITSE